MERPSWLDSKPPEGYQPGIGRGAQGFMTRSDLGPASIGDFITVDPSAERGDDENEDLSESKFDQWGGYGGSIFSGLPYDEEDRVADEIWQRIDERMDLKRRVRREKREKEEEEKVLDTRPKIAQQFQDLKRNLSGVSEQEWFTIPEVVRSQVKKKMKNNDRFGFSPVPDSLFEKARQETEMVNEVELTSGMETPLGTATPMTDITAIGQASRQMLHVNLKKVADSVSGQTVVDPKGYLTSLSGIKTISAAEIGDLKKARLLLKSIRMTNPKHGPSWIASARLEEVANKLPEARKLILEGCTAVPDNEDVWLEAARLADSPSDARILLARAIRHVPKSVRVWLQATELETEVANKKKVLRKALEHIPTSVKLWKAAIELEEPNDAKLLLQRAVECIPGSVELWLALANLETYENARKVLNDARRKIPTDHSIWIAAAKLEEVNHNPDRVEKVIERAVKSLQSHSVTLSHEQWIKEAEQAENNQAPVTCGAIIRQTLHLGVEPVDQRRVWMDDAEGTLSRGSIETTRCIYATALAKFPSKKSLWKKLAMLEKTHGTRLGLFTALEQAVSHCPNAEVLWLMFAKEKWMDHDLDSARSILGRAFENNPNSEQIWLAATKLESENGQHARARALLKKAREQAGTAKVWKRSVIVERDAKNFKAERGLLEEALHKFPQTSVFWRLLGELNESEGMRSEAQEAYQKGLKNCPDDPKLWERAVLLEESLSVGKARAMLEKARKFVKQSPRLWLLAIQIEMRAGNPKVAENIMAKALQDCPDSGELWASHIEMAPTRQLKQSRSVDALKKCESNPIVMLAVAKFFWSDNKPDKARTWFNRAVSLAPDNGDLWIWFMKFELVAGNSNSQDIVRQRCIEAEPVIGELWKATGRAVVASHATPAERTAFILKTATDQLSYQK